MSTKSLALRTDLTEGPLLPKIILFSIPLILTGILQLLFNTADTIVVGRWGGATPDECETALAAVGSCGALINLIVNFFAGLSVGAGVCAARAIGAKDTERAERVVHTSVLTALIAGIIVCLVGILFAPQILILMGTEPVVLDEATPYIRAYFLGAPANMIYTYCAALLRSDGDTKHPLMFLSFAGVANVGLNLLMVIVFDMGALGVGLATAASHWISCMMIVVFLSRSKTICHLDFRRLRMHAKEFKEIVTIGIPAGLQSALFSISNVLIQSSVNTFDKATVAANSASSNLCNYTFVSMDAFYHASLTFTGQHFGAAKIKRMKQSFLACAGCVTVVGLAVGLTELYFGRELLSIFIVGNERAIEIGMISLRIELSTYFLCGLMNVGCGVLRGLGHSLSSMLTTLVGACLFRIVWIYTVFEKYKTLQSLYLSYPASWFLTMVAIFILCFFVIRKVSRNVPEARLEILEEKQLVEI